MPTFEPGINCDLVLAFHADESLSTGTPRTVGIRLLRDDQGNPKYSVTNLANAELVNRVRSLGYEVNEETMEATFYKDNWSNGFGAYEDRPGVGKVSFTEGIDTKGQHPILAPKKYTMTWKTYTATTISFSTTTPGTILDSANGFAEFKTGDVVTVTGSASNNGTYNISTGAVAGTIRTTEATTAEGAGASITIAVANGGSVADVKRFGGSVYVQFDNKYVYKVTNWGTAGSSYLVSVFKHSGGGSEVGTFLFVHNSYLYACYGTTGAYAYSSNGTTWTLSNLGGTDQQATEMITLRGVLHKRVGSDHYQCTNPTDTGINQVPQPWSSADQIGDTSYIPSKMLVLADSLVFATVAGLENLDGEGQVNSLLPNLINMSGGAIANAAQSWLNSAIFLPLSDGSVKLYHGGEAIPVTPKVEALLDGVSQMINPTITQYISFSAVAGDFIYTHQVDGDDDTRIMELEQIGTEEYIWRTLFAMRSTSPVFNKLFAAYFVGGPVLGIDASSGGRFHYWLMPNGRDALQDSRCRFESSGIIYDPWITFGCPEVTKRWSYVEVAVTESTPANFAKTTYTLDGYNEAGSDIVTSNSLTLAQGITIGNISFNSNSTSRRMRLLHTLANTGTNQELETPILLWIRVHAYLCPDPKWKWQFTAEVNYSGGDDGTTTQDELRLFLKDMRGCKLPMTLITPYKDGPNNDGSWTVNPARQRPGEALTSTPGWGYDQIAEMILIQQVAGN